LIIDTTSNPNNVWQIGIPQKQLLYNAFSNPNVIITDTINSYPVSDTSSFEIIHLAEQGLSWGYGAVVSGYYSVYSDEPGDYGKIEFSPDNGITWIDLINDSLGTQCPNWDTQKPVLTGNSNGWQYFDVWFGCIASSISIQLGDTVIYRFTWISDSIPSNKDGLMFDNLNFADWAEGIEELQSNHLLHLSPNPVSTELHITLDEPINNGTVSLMSYEGKPCLPAGKVIMHQQINNTSATLDLSAIAPGMYYVLFRSEKIVAVKKVVVAH